MNPPEDAALGSSPGRSDEARRYRRGGAVWVGVAFVLLGILLILQTMGIVRIVNWWALFILIPAVALLSTAVNSLVRSGGRFTRSVSGPLVGALFTGSVALIFLLSLDWSRVWPVTLVLVGLAILMNTIARRV